MLNQCQRYLIYSHYCRSQIKISKKLRKTRFFYNLNILVKKDTKNILKASQDKTRQVMTMPKKTKQTEEEKKLVGILNEYMRIYKLTQTEMADRLEIQQGTLSNWITGNNGIAPSCQERIKFICRGVIQQGEANAERQRIIQEITSRIMGSDMCADCKIKAYNIIKGIE
jgi:predicted transcriptional regulator